MKNSEKSFQWIIGILRKHDVPFVVTGGLAANIYGSPRDLYDIDIEIPEKYFETILSDIKPYIVFGPGRLIDEYWDLELVILNHEGQMIDISGGETVKICNTKTKEWQLVPTDFKHIEEKEVFGITVPVVHPKDLLAYKLLLLRDHEMIDIEAVQKYLKN